jgi:hypothetical protein
MLQLSVVLVALGALILALAAVRFIRETHPARPQPAETLAEESTDSGIGVLVDSEVMAGTRGNGTVIAHRQMPAPVAAVTAPIAARVGEAGAPPDAFPHVEEIARVDTSEPLSNGQSAERGSSEESRLRRRVDVDSTVVGDDLGASEESGGEESRVAEDVIPAQDYPIDAPSQPDIDDEDVVVVVPGRGRYHRPDCAYAVSPIPAVALALVDALADGYESCQICAPEER